MTPFERLAIKIKADVGIEACNFKRLYTGYWQKKAGAWVWRADYTIEGKAYVLGSQWPATALLSANKLVTSTEHAFDTDIFPD
jgi:hypothetical protein